MLNISGKYAEQAKIALRSLYELSKSTEGDFFRYGEIKANAGDVEFPRGNRVTDILRYSKLKDLVKIRISFDGRSSYRADLSKSLEIEDFLNVVEKVKIPKKKKTKNLLEERSRVLALRSLLNLTQNGSEDSYFLSREILKESDPPLHHPMNVAWSFSPYVASGLVLKKKIKIRRDFMKYRANLKKTSQIEKIINGYLNSVSAK